MTSDSSSRPRSSLTPLRHRLLLLTVLGMVPVVVFAALSIYSAMTQHRNELSRSTLDLSRAVASAVLAELDAHISVLYALSASNELAGDNLPALHAEMQASVANRPDWNSVVLSDDSGAILFRTTAPFGAGLGPPVESDSLQRAIRTRSPQVGSLAQGPGERFAYAVRVPIMREGRLRYVLTATVSPRRTVDLLQRQKVPNDWVISIFDSELRRVARSRDHDNTLGGEPAPSLKQLLGNGQPEGSGTTRALEGDEIVTGFTRIPTHGWVVAVGAPTHMLTSNIMATLSWYLLGVGASVGFAVFLARWVGRRLSSEIQEVVHSASRIGAGTQPLLKAPRTAEIAALLEHVNHADRRVQESEAASAQALVQAQQAAAAKDEFLAVLSHELRNPLAPIVNVLTLLDMKANEETLRERQILRRQVTHMKRLVDDLLDVSRLVHGRVILHRKPLNLKHLLEQVIDTFVQHGSDDACMLSCGQEAWVDGDETRLTQVFTNLLSNAERYSAGAPVHVRVVAGQETVCVQVIDRGVGVQSADLERIFEPFFQVEPLRNGVSGNVGLGLAICRKLVELHDGTIDATSPGPGLGTQFNVVLPALVPHPALSRVPHEPPGAPQGQASSV